MEAIRVKGCSCLSCESAKRAGVKPTKPRTEVEALLYSLRPITAATRVVAVARIRGDRVLSVRFRREGR